MRYIITLQEKAKQYLKEEMLKIDTSFKILKNLDDSHLLVESRFDQEEFYNLIHKENEVFIRHVFQVKNIIEDELNKQLLEILFLNLQMELEYSIQISGTISKEEKIELKEFLLKNLTLATYKYSEKEFYQVISIFKHESKYYVGCNETYLNLSPFKSGNCYMKNTKKTISRAEHKLEEVLFYVEAPQRNKTALDLGAAPGGWSKVLLDLGYSVTAIDPGALDKRLLTYKKLVYYKESSQQFLNRKINNKYDLIVNDMKMDVKKSFFIIKQLKPFSHNETLYIMTVKLPKVNWLKNIISTIKMVNKEFEIVFSRQLFYNKSEIVIVFKNRE